MREQSAISVRRRSWPVIPLPPVAMVSGLCDGMPVEGPDGARPVETLREGDPVLTRDGGAQPLIGVLRSDPVGAKTIRVEAGTLGNPQTCHLGPATLVRICGWPVELHFGLQECLVPIGDLCGTPGITAATGQGGVTALILAEPALLRAGGLDLESQMAAGPQIGPASLATQSCLPVIGGAEARLLAANGPA